jgi:hypothetical protein
VWNEALRKIPVKVFAVKKTDQDERVPFHYCTRSVISNADAVVPVAVFDLGKIAYLLQMPGVLDPFDGFSQPIFDMCLLDAFQISEEAFLEIDFQLAPQSVSKTCSLATDSEDSPYDPPYAGFCKKTSSQIRQILTRNQDTYGSCLPWCSLDQSSFLQSQYHLMH